MKTFRNVALAGLALATVPAAAFAVDRGDIRQLNETKITLTQAIAAAEKDRGGRAIDAGLDDDSFRPAYEVTVVAGDRIWDVQVDGVSGEVTGSREDLDD